MDAIINQIKLKVKNQDQQIKLINFIISSKNGQKIPKLFVLYGTGNTGKTTLIELIRNYLGESCVNIHAWQKSDILHQRVISRVRNKNLIVLQHLLMREKLSNKYIMMLIHDKFYTVKCVDKDNELYNNTANYLIETNKLDILDNLTKDMYEIIEFS